MRTVASEPPRGFLSLHGKALKTAAEKKTLRTVEWAYRLKLAGQNDIMQSIEMAHAADRVDLFYASDRKQIRGRPIADYVSSEYGVALLLDQHVNRPGHVPKVLAQAVAAFVDERGGNDEPSLWSADDEARLLEIYIRLRNATSMTDAQARADRTRKAADLGLASDRRGSYEA